MQHPAVAGAEDEEEGSGHTGADDAADLLEVVEPVAQGARGRSYHDAGDDDDGRVPQAEEGADRHGALARRDQAACHQVDGGDVVGVQRVAEAERVGEDGRGDHLGDVMEDNANGGPHDEIHGDETPDQGGGWGGYGPERTR